MNDYPLVSLFVICYNHERFVLEALESARKQTYPNIELIILDDCSTDNSVSLIQDWISRNNVKCRFIKHSENVGVVKSLNECLMMSSGSYISFFATDDLIIPDKTTRLMEILLNSPPDVGVVYGDLEVIDEIGQVTHRSFYEWYLQGTRPPSGNIFDYYLERNPIQILGAVIRKEVYDVLGFYDESLIYEDWDMGMRIARTYKFLFCPEAVGSYRKFSGQMTDVFWRDQEKHRNILSSDFKMFSKHLDLRNYRNQLLKKLCEIFINQSKSNFISWRLKIKSSFFLLSNGPGNLKFWILFFGSLINRPLFVYRVFRNVFKAINL